MTFSFDLTYEQIDILIKKYSEYSCPLTNEHMMFRAKIKTSTMTIFHTRKVLIQGTKADEVNLEICKLFNIENKIVEKNQEKLISAALSFNMSIIGTDEVGTGDYFGGIVVCACFIPKEKIEFIQKLGVKDSKKMADKKILEIAPIIKQETINSSVLLNNEKYNEIIKHPTMNMNRIKAILHNRVINNLLKKNISYDTIIIDGFTSKLKYFEYLEGKNDIIKNINLVEEAESKYTSVAAASVLARYYFLKNMAKISQEYGYELPKGAGSLVDQTIARILHDGKEKLLNKIAKINFKNTEKVKRNDYSH